MPLPWSHRIRTVRVGKEWEIMEKRALLHKGWSEVPVTIWDLMGSSLGWEHCWCKPKQLIATQPCARHVPWLVGLCLSEEPPGTDCMAGLGTASLLCLLFTAMQFGRIVLAAHRHSWSRSASRTHGCVCSPVSSALLWEETEFQSLEETSCVWSTSDDLTSCIAYAWSYPKVSCVLKTQQAMTLHSKHVYSTVSTLVTVQQWDNMNSSGCIGGSKLSKTWTSITQGKDLAQCHQLWWILKLFLVGPCCLT